MGDTVYNPTTGNTAYKFTSDDKLDFIAPVKLAGTEITATAAELNILDGVTATKDEINTLDGITATATELNEYSVQVYMADANTAGSVFAYIPHAGAIRGISVVAQAANADTKTVFTAEIGGTLVTCDAIELAADAAAGTKVSRVPSADNAVAADSVLELISDGGGSSVMPVMWSVKILR